MFWLIALAVVLVLGALAWWTSGRARRGVDSSKMHTSIAKSQSNVGMRSGRPEGGPGGPSIGGPGGF
ncbi:hypothetical protein ABLE68_21335 [Nocardioides sp. CN2-186]|uniref:hypothetical protein n=1 Tax=Nocardioides tweenelious TaxID=3156607 RepID=UPI0032B3C516